MTFADNILNFIFHLKLPFNLAGNIEVLDVHKDLQARKACTLFYKKFYSDDQKRHLLLGINPGRFGGGVTGIPFTDPIRLEKNSGIRNDFKKKQELSSVFMYEMIEAFGGTKMFYKQFYISAISPLGFIKEGKNLNYYDDKDLLKSIEPFVVDCLQKQLSFGIYRNVCFCIGEGQNLRFLTALNKKHQWFNEIKALSHPRFIMQYKLKQKSAYIKQYLDAFGVKH